MIDLKNTTPAPHALILLVDDTPRNLQVLGNILKKHDYHLAVATDGMQALERIHDVQPDLILLDIMMPGLSGFDVCKKLKENPNTVDIPVIFLTAKTETEDIVKGFNLGAVDYITKPFNGTELLARVKTHLTLKQTRDALKNALASKDRFFSIIAHDLRSPFNTIVSFLKLTARGSNHFSNEELMMFIDELRTKADTTKALLENLLQWAQSQTDGIQFNSETMPAQDIIDECITFMNTHAAYKGIELKTTVDTDLQFTGDRHMMATVLRNIISNSIKFSHREGQIMVDARHYRSGIEFSVKDNGVGMSEKVLNKLFKIDTKITTEGTEQERGSGLGLILCNEFVKRHNGSLHVESEKNVGSCFFIRIPQKQKDIKA
ncbi:hybrid sensor histidine kinase/response regulator [bacterium]|nr:hybrid sensor histidine kinase/response regulator [bacterium]